MNNFTNPPEQHDSDLEPSKSQRKRDMKELHKLGKLLVEAPAHLLNNINLEENLSNAILLARKLSNDGSKRRQLLYIAKLLSHIETEAITQEINKYNIQQHSINKAFHDIEKWRDRLIQNSDQALDELLNLHGNLDRQHLRQLIRNAQKEAAEQKPPASSRAIFKYLKENIKSDNSNIE